MRVPGLGEIPRSRRGPILVLLGLLVAAVVQLRWWTFDQERFAVAVAVQLEQVRDGAEASAALDWLRAEQQRRARQYAWEGSFFVVVLTACLVSIWTSLQAEIASRRKQETFLSLVSHQFKTPLASLRLAVETLSMRRVEPAHQARLVDRALDDVQRLEDLVGNILEAARLDAGRVVLRRDPVSLARLANQVVERVGERAARQKAQVSVEVPAGVMVLADPVAVDAALRNVLENAVASVGAVGGGTVAVRAVDDGRHVEVTVSDSGVGFDPADAGRLFEKFGFIDLAYRAGERTGLGLYIVRRLMQLGGGEVRAESNGLGHGARFVLRWPRAEDEGPA